MSMPVSSRNGDLKNMNDQELEQLVDQTGNKNRNTTSSTSSWVFRSRWLVAFAVLLLAFVVLFMTDATEIETGAESEITKQKGDSNVALPETIPDKAYNNSENNGLGMPEVGKDSSSGNPASSPGVQTGSPTSQATESPKTGTMPSNQGTAASATSVSFNDLGTEASDEAKIEAFKVGLRPQVKYEYTPRSTSPESIRQEYAKKWGEWKLQDPKADQRPKNDFAGQFPDRDIPWDKFSPNAWQTDQEYLSNFLAEGKALAERAIEAILAEYGWSKFDLPEKTLDERLDVGSFKVEMVNLTETTTRIDKRRTIGDTLGGWITQEYFDGLVRRILHAVITEDTFTFVMGGHSAAAGHGNHFRQSYTMQFHKIMEPIFARLGVRLNSHNIAYGGLGTVQTSMAAGDLYGREIDVLCWDSGMTENSADAYDLYVRQAYLSGNRIPVLIGGIGVVLEDLNKRIGAEVANMGTGIDGVPEVKNPSFAEKVPWAARFVKCDAEIHKYCREMEYNGTCWIDRPDYEPATKQKAAPGGRASWHPGFKFHALKGRIIAITMLRAIHKGLSMWEEAPEKRLPEHVWHVRDHYENLRIRLKNISKEESPCYHYDALVPKTLCEVPFNGLSEMTPRANPKQTAIRNIMKPAHDGYLPMAEDSVYDPPDVFNVYEELPDGEFDYLAVVENGVPFSGILTFDNSPLPPLALKTNNKLIPLGVDGIKPGLGWSLDSASSPDTCDGSWKSFCNRGIAQDCLLYGHNDYRGGLQFDSFSGWGIFTVPNVKLGVIFVRLEWWHGPGNPRTVGWTEENNGTSPADLKRYLSDSIHGVQQRVDESSRHLKGPVLCEKFQFEFVVNGKKTSYNADQFHEKLLITQRVVQLQHLLNDPTLTNGEPHDVEVAIRIAGCELKHMFKLSHIYWA